MNFIVGLDLGQAADYTAIVIAEKLAEGYHIRHVKREPLGTSYPAVVEHVKTLLETEPLCWPGTYLVVDATGVGAAVVDMFRLAGLRPICVSITGGGKETQEGNTFHVPKRNLVGALQVLLQGGRLKIAEGIPEARDLIQELLAFRVKISDTAHDSYGNDWRENPHDDLVLAAAMAIWYGERGRGVLLR